MNLTQTACGAPVRDRAGRFKTMNLALSTVTLIIAGIRFVSKYLFSIRQGFGPDDWTMLAAGLIGIPCIVFNIFGLSGHGLGKDIWTLAPEAVVSFTQWFLAMELLYVVIITIVKISLSLFYLDLFPGAIFRRLIWGTIIFHIASGLSFVVGSLVQCVPLSFTWEQFRDNSNSFHGHCVNVHAFGWANAAINVAVDVWLIGIPLFKLYKLDTHWRRKLSAAIMFMTGVMCDCSPPFFILTAIIHSLTFHHQSYGRLHPPIPVSRPLRQLCEPNMGPLEHCLVVHRRSQHKHYLHVSPFHTAHPGTHVSASHWFEPWSAPNVRGLLDWRKDHQPESFGYRTVGTVQQ